MVAQVVKGSSEMSARGEMETAVGEMRQLQIDEESDRERRCD